MVVVEDIQKMPQTSSPVHLAIGMFDGIHIGHQAVIEACVNSAQNSAGNAAVLTFWPHPSKILRPEAPVPQIMTLESKLWTLERKGLHFAIVQGFKNEFANLRAEEFVAYLKKYIPTLKSLFVGQNFRFGKGRKGDVTLLQKTAIEEGVHLVSMEHCKYDGEVISSTRIRNLLKENRFNEIPNLLGHPYTVMGQTAPGRKVGRKIGYPTLNIDWAPELKPPYGVYAVRMVCHQKHKKLGTPVAGVANYGIRPTYDLGDDPVLEVHLFEAMDLEYGSHVAIELIEFLRFERKFTDQDALIRQISEDVSRAKTVLGVDGSPLS